MTDPEQGFLRAIRESADPAHKLAYADWLRDHGRVDLAYACEWAARRGLHPAISPAGRVVRWRRAPKVIVQRRRPRPESLPAPVFDALPWRPRVPRGKESSPYDALTALAAALYRLRVLVSLSGGPS